MCIIVDANVASAVFSSPTHADFVPVVNWLFGARGKLVVGGKLEEELSKVSKAGRALVSLKRAGRLRQVPITGTVIPSTGLPLKSNDQHIIMLALAAGSRLLVSRDKLLHADFTNPKLLSPRGKVYQNASHSALLRLDTCP